MKSLMTLVLFLTISAASYAQGIEFVHVKWQEAMEMAKEENKLMFVDSYAEWCGPCKRMAKNEFVKADVGEIYNDNFVNLKLDMESKNGRTFDSKYPVSAYPTMFFLDGEGNVVKKVRGGQKGEQLIAMAKAAIKSYDSSGKFAEKYDEGDRSYETVYQYVEALNKSQKPSLKISNDYLKSNPEISEEQKLKFYHIATVDADSKIFEKMVANKSALIAVIGEEAFDKKVKTACTNTVEKAVEYEMEDLLIEAIEKSKALTDGADAFQLESKMTYGRAMKDLPMYKKAAKSLSKIYLKRDIEKINDVIIEMHSTFGDDMDMIKMSGDIAKKYHKKSKSVKSALAYAKSSLLLNDLDKAKDILTDAIETAKKKGENTKTLAMMVKVIEQKMKA